MSVFAGRAVFPAPFTDAHGNGRGGLSIAVYERITYTDGVTTDGDETFASDTVAFTSDDEDKLISGEGIPTGATIATYVNATTVELSVPATATGTGQSFQIAGRQRLADLATVYSDRLKSVAAANPYVADGAGNTFPFLDTGDYDAVTVHGVTPFTVLPDPSEPIAAGAVEEAMLSFGVATQAELDTFSAATTVALAGKEPTIPSGTFAGTPVPGTPATAVVTTGDQERTGILSLERARFKNTPFVDLSHPSWAVPTGYSADASAAIQAAATAAGTGVLYIPPGALYLLLNEVVFSAERLTILVGGDCRIRLESAAARLRFSAFSIFIIGGQLIVDGRSLATNGIVVTKGARSQFEKVLVQNCLGDGVLINPDGTGGGSCNHITLRKCRSINNGGDGYEVADSVAVDSTSFVLDDCEATGNGGNGALIRNNLPVVRGGLYTGNALYGITLGLAADVNRTTDNALIDGMPRLEDNVTGPFSEGKGTLARINLSQSYSEHASYQTNPTGNNWRWHYSSANGGYTLVASDGTRWKFRNSDGITEIPGRLALAAGTVSAPAIYPNGDSDTGLSFPAANQVAATTGGTERWRLSNSGQQWKTSIAEFLTTTAASGASLTVSATTSNVHDITLTANCALTLSAAFSGSAVPLTLILRQDATGGRVPTWPASVKWAGGAAPTLSAAANAIDIITLVTLDAGTTWFGNVGGLAFA